MPIAKLESTTLQGVSKIVLDVARDARGKYVETFNEHEYFEEDLQTKFVQDDFSVSKYRVLRGIHGDSKTWKLICCPYGEIYLVVVDCRLDFFGKWEGFTLNDENVLQILVPPNRGVAHLVMSDYAVFSYKQSTYYDRNSQFTYRYNSPAFNIKWPISGNPILSDRDANAPQVMI